MHTRRLVAAVSGLGLLLGLATAFAQEKKDPAKPPAKPAPGAATKPAGGPPGETTPEMQAAMQAMLPGPAHEKLAKLAGDWTSKSTLSFPGAQAEATEGTSKIMVVMDGRFIQQEDTGTMMGTPFKSAHLMGYNNGSKKYEAVWTYTLGTSMLMMTGTSDDDGRTIKCSAAFENEIGATEKLNVTYNFADADHFTVILDGGKMPDGSPGPVMEMVYTRKK